MNIMTENEEKKDFSEMGDDRGTTKLPKSPNKKMGFGIVLLGLLLLGIFIIPNFFKKNSDEIIEEPKNNSEVSVKSKNNFNFHQEEKQNTDEKLFVENETEKSERPPFILGEPTQDAPLITKSVPKSKRNFMVKNGGSNTDSQTDIAIAQAETMYSSQGASNNSSNDDIFKAPAFKASKAEKSKYNQHLLLSQGTLIPCVLRGRLVSNISGQISCIIADNVYSQSGSVLLVEKGSRVNGYYQGNSANHGSNEIFAVWQEIRTPNNLVIPLMSGSTDELGANGLRGWADNHFWDRFKNAILLSLIKDATGVLANRASREGRYDYSENTREGSEDIAKTVLDQMGDIRPTIYKNQGDKVGIFVARDIDFSNVYELREK